MPETFNAVILGRTLPLKVNGNEDYLREVVEYVNRKVDEVKGKSAGTTDLNVALLAILNIADDYFVALGKQRAVFSQIEQRCDDLIEYIDSKL